MSKRIKVRWAGRMSFIATDDDNHSVLMDTSKNIGGDNAAFKASDLLMVSLGGCTAVDVISILKKQKQDIREFRIEVEGTNAKDYPKYYTEIKLNFILRGRNINPEFVERAIDLSHHKYCSVGQSLEPKVKIITNFTIEEVND